MFVFNISMDGMNVGKQSMVYLYNGILFKLYKETNYCTESCNNRNKTPDIILNERNWAQKWEDCMILFI